MIRSAKALGKCLVASKRSWLMTWPSRSLGMAGPSSLAKSCEWCAISSAEHVSVRFLGPRCLVDEFGSGYIEVAAGTMGSTR